MNAYYARWTTKHYDIGPAQVAGSTVRVPVHLQLDQGFRSSLTVVLNQTAHHWVIADFMYPTQNGIKAFTLLNQLHLNLKH